MDKRWYVPVLSVCLAVVLAAALMLDALFADDGVIHATSGGSVEELEQKLDLYVFPKDRIIDVKVTLDEEDFQDMLANPMAEAIKPASVEYNGIRLDNIGIRTKGNLSLTSVAHSDSDRYSFKLIFDEYISQQTMFGIGKITLNNSYSDPTYIREVLAYELAEVRLYRRDHIPQYRSKCLSPTPPYPTSINPLNAKRSMIILGKQ